MLVIARCTDADAPIRHKSQMAILIVFTVIFSVLYSLFWFMPLLGLVGPEGELGTVFKFKKWKKGAANQNARDDGGESTL